MTDVQAPADLKHPSEYTVPDPGEVDLDDTLAPLQARRDYLDTEIANGQGFIKATYANIKTMRGELERIDKVLRAARPAKSKPAKFDA